MLSKVIFQMLFEKDLWVLQEMISDFIQIEPYKMFLKSSMLVTALESFLVNCL